TKKASEAPILRRSENHRSRSVVADNFELDPVPVEEVEAPARLIIVMAPGLETVFAHDLLRRIEVVDKEADVIERASLFLACMIKSVGIEREVGRLLSHMDRFAAVHCRAAPALMPAEQFLEEGRRSFDVGDSEVDVLDSSCGHVRGSCRKSLFLRHSAWGQRLPQTLSLVPFATSS